MAFEFSKSGWWANKLILLKCFIDLSICAMDYWKLRANYSWAATEKIVEVTCQSMLPISNYLSNKYGNHWRRWFLNFSYSNWWAVVTVTDKKSFHTPPFIKCLDQKSFFTILSTQFFKKKAAWCCSSLCENCTYSEFFLSGKIRTKKPPNRDTFWPAS